MKYKIRIGGTFWISDASSVGTVSISIHFSCLSYHAQIFELNTQLAICSILKQNKIPFTVIEIETIERELKNATNS